YCMWMLFSSTIQKTNYDMIKQNQTLINEAIPLSTILIVDDDEHIRKLVSVHLNEAGYEVETASDGEKALHILEKEPIDMAIVDNDEHIRKLVSVHLNEAGYEVETASDGEKALHILEKEPIDMAIVDIMMPIVDGYELTEDIRDFYDIPVILLTAKDQIEDKEK